MANINKESRKKVHTLSPLEYLKKCALARDIKAPVKHGQNIAPNNTAVKVLQFFFILKMKSVAKIKYI